MPSRSLNPPPEEWSQHEGTIRRLYHDNNISLRRMIQILRTDFKFNASPSHYEQQFKKWGLSKNLSKEAWRLVLGTLDALHARDIQARLKVSGKHFGENKILRARKWAPNATHVSDTSWLAIDEHRHIAIEFVDSSGQWSELTVNTSIEQLPPSGRVVMQIEDSQADGPLQRPHSPRNNQPQEQQVLGLVDTPEFDLDMSGFLLGASDLVGNPSMMSARGSPPLTLNDSTLDLCSTNVPGVQDSFVPQNLETLSMSPFYQLSDLNIYNWAWNFDHTSSQMHHITAKSSITMQPYLCLIQGALQDAKSDREKIAPLHPTLSQALGRLQSLLLEGIPSESTSSSHNHNGSALPIANLSFDMISADAILYSIANNFAGLQDIPPGSLFRLLSSQQSLTSRLYDYLHDCPPFLSKAFADNVFRAAVEAGDAQAVKRIARITKGRSNEIDPNASRCELEGRRLAPLLFAFNVGNTKLASILVELGANVHQSLRLKPGSDMSESLGREIRSALKWRRLNSKHSFASYPDSALVAILAKAGKGAFKITLPALEGTDVIDFPQITAAVLDHLAPYSHKDVFRTLGWWAKRYGFIPSVELLKRWVGICKEQECFHCLRCSDANFPERQRPLDWIVLCAASNGNLELCAFLCSTIKISHLTFSSHVRRQHSAVTTLLESYGAIVETSDLVSRFLSRGPAFIEAVEQLEDANSDDKEEQLRSIVRTTLEANDIHGLVGLLRQGTESGDTVAFPTTIRICIDLYLKDWALEALLTSYDPFHILIENSGAMQEHEVEDFVLLLLDAGCRIRELDFIKIASSGNVALVRMLLEAGKMALGIDDVTALETVIEGGHIGILELLLQHGFELRAQIFGINRAYARTSLACAARKGDRQMVDLLLLYGSDPADDWAFHNTVKEQPHLLDTLLEAFQIRYPTNCIRFGAVALLSAIESNRMDTLQMLLDAGMSVRSYGEEKYEGIKPLYAAITYPGCNNVEAIGILLEAGADINGIVALKKTGDPSITILPRLTPLLSAIDTQNIDTVRFLLEKGADINGAGLRGLNRTPLQRACEIGNYKIVRLLLLYGAEVNAKACLRAGGTALQLAAATGSIAIAKLLIARGANVNDPTSLVNGRTAIEAAAEHGRIDMIKVLWDTTGGRGFLPKDVESAMKLATKQKHQACVDYLTFLNDISVQQRLAQEMMNIDYNLDTTGLGSM